MESNVKRNSSWQYEPKWTFNQPPQSVNTSVTLCAATRMAKHLFANYVLLQPAEPVDSLYVWALMKRLAWPHIPASGYVRESLKGAGINLLLSKSNDRSLMSLYLEVSSVPPAADVLSVSHWRLLCHSLAVWVIFVMKRCAPNSFYSSTERAFHWYLSSFPSGNETACW